MQSKSASVAGIYSIEKSEYEEWGKKKESGSTYEWE